MLNATATAFQTSSEVKCGKCCGGFLEIGNAALFNGQKPEGTANSWYTRLDLMNAADPDTDSDANACSSCKPIQLHPLMFDKLQVADGFGLFPH